MSIKSCLDCPSLLDQEQAKKFFGVAEAAPMCSRFGHIFGKMNSDEVEVGAAEKFAAGCSSFGQQAPASPPPSITASWFTPRSELLEVHNDARVKTCGDCVNFDDNAKACAATGRILFYERREVEATGCSWASYRNVGQPSNRVNQPMFAGTTQVFVKNASTTTTKTATKKVKSMPAKITDPATYDSDAEVTEEHKKVGIRAWRKHETDRGKVYYLPIFRTDYFGDQAAKIPTPKSEYGDPTLYIDHAGLLTEFAVQVYKKDLNLCLVAEPGAGKTEGVRWIAYMLNMPFYRIAYTNDTDPDEVLGTYQYDPQKGTYLDLGTLPTIWQLPGVGLSDETNLGPEACVQSYRSMNDSSRILKVYKEEILRHDYHFHFQAINPHWDFRNIGAKPLASADSRRMSFFWMPNPDKAMMKKIITQTVQKLDGEAPPKELVDLIVKIGEDLREMSKEGTLPDFWTVSQEIKVARLVDDFGLEGAYRRAYFNYIDPQDAEPAMASIKSHVPYGSDWA